MKKIQLPLTAILLLIHSVISAQVQKNVVVEHFTNTRCTICSSRNPGFYSNLASYPQVLHIAFHPSSPYAACLLSQHNVAENDWRTNFYGVYGATPRFVIQGQVISPLPSYTDSTLFTSQLGQTTPVALTVQHQQANDSFRTEVRVVSKQFNSLGSVSLNVFVVEDTLFYNSPNGEAMHYDVFRKSFTGTTPLTVQIPANAGDSVVMHFAVAYHPDWNKKRIYAMALLQNTNKNIIQAGSSQNQAPLNNTASRQPAQMNFTVYPNPAVDYLVIEESTGSLQKATLSIRNQAGQMVFAQQVDSASRQLVQLPALQNGVYFYSFTSNAAISATGKLIIIR